MTCFKREKLYVDELDKAIVTTALLGEMSKKLFYEKTCPKALEKLARIH